MWTSVGALLTAIVASGCSAPAVANPCDGSDRVTLSALEVEMPPEVYQALKRSTPDSLLVDGQCRYWVGNRGPFSEVRTGRLSSTEALTLSREVGFALWASLAGDHGDHTMTDQGRTVLRDGRRAHRPVCCYDGCGAQDGRVQGSPGPLADAVRALSTWNVALWKRGTALQGPVRYAVYRQDYDFEASDAAWPEDAGALTSNADPAATYERPIFSPGGTEGRTATGAVAVALRRLRERAPRLARADRDVFIPVRDGHMGYALRVWDVLPEPAAALWGSWSYCGWDPGIDW
jgi:hypothetical protein